MQRNFGLDFLRALAISLVIISHGGRLLNDLGHAGVELFFVLSGFLIGAIFLKDIVNARDLSVADLIYFWKRRWWRTLPSYALFLVIYLAVFVIGSGTLPARLPLYLAFLQSFAWDIGNFFPVTWSLAVEEWFYLLMPVLFWMIFTVKRDRRWAFGATVVALIIVPTVLRFATFHPGNYSVVREATAFRLDALMFGVALAAIKNYRPLIWAKLPGVGVLGMIGVLALLALNWGLHEGTPRIPAALTFTLYPIFCACLIPMVSLWEPKPSRFGAAVSRIALISYSLYLVHMLFVEEELRLQVVMHARPALVWVLRLATVVLIYAAAEILYRYFESPLTSRRPTKQGDARALGPVV